MRSAGLGAFELWRKYVGTGRNGALALDAAQLVVEGSERLAAEYLTPSTPFPVDRTRELRRQPADPAGLTFAEEVFSGRRWLN